MKTILIIILAILGLRIIFRFMRPYVIKFIMKKLEHRMNNSMGFNSVYEEPKQEKEGSISIDKMPKQSKPKGDTSDLGEYIDYEEIE